MCGLGDNGARDDRRRMIVYDCIAGMTVDLNVGGMACLGEGRTSFNEGNCKIGALLIEVAGI